MKWLEQNNYTCGVDCVHTIPWDEPQFGCDSFGQTRQNLLCTIGIGYFYCHGQNYRPTDPPAKDWGIVSAGTCECPSDCSSALRGKCEAKGCTCHPGYTGRDCATVTCGKQQCFNRGKCFSSFALGSDYCRCDAGFSGDDCSSVMIPEPSIPAVLPYPQYAHDKYGDQHPVFNESVIAQIRITMDPETLRELILPSNEDARDYQITNVTFYNGVVEERLNNVGIHVKGSASAAFAKKSWKLSFNTFESGRTFYGLKKLDLKAASMVPMFVRERASIAAIYSMGAPTPRSSFAQVYINNLAWGAYVMLEDEGRDEFVKSRLGNSDGALWKVSSCNLSYIGSDPDLYRNPALGYTAENDLAEADYSPLERFIEILNLTPDDEFEEQIQTIFNVEYFLRTLAAEVMTGNYDGIWNGNNFFLYYNTDSLFYYYRQDLDLALGANQVTHSFSQKNIWTWGQGGRGGLLVTRVLSVPSFRAIYATYLTKLMDYVNPVRSGPYMLRLEALHQQIAPVAQRDYWRRFDLLFSFVDFSINLHNSIIRENIDPNPLFPQETYELDRNVATWLAERVFSATRQLAEGPPAL